MISVPTFSQLRRSLLASDGGDAAKSGKQNVKWVEGVRGVASFFVVITHLCRAWDYQLWFPRDTEHAEPRLMQLPFLRLPWQGRIGVTMFAFLTGYVCAIKPLRQAKSGNINGALLTLSKSAFRRPPRLIMPATIAMAIAWFFAQIGGFKVSQRCDAPWLRYSSPRNIGSLDTEIPRLFHAFKKNWVENHNEFDDHQWALKPLLNGAFLIYIIMMATIMMKSQWRMFTLVVLFFWYWYDPSPFTETFTLQFIYGVLLCDIGSETKFREFVNRHPKVRRSIQWTLIVTGIYVAGYPLERPEWCTWSNQLSYIADNYFPGGADRARRWSAVGWDLAVTGIWLSPTLQELFSNRMFMWLGKNSFAVYLTHGTVLRVLLVRLVYGWSGEPFVVNRREDGSEDPQYLKKGGPMTFMIAVPIFFVVEYTIARLWTQHVDTWCAKVTQKMENLMFSSEEDEKRGHLLPA